MAHIPIFAFSAFSGTGKTTVIEKLVVALNAKELRVAVIKHDGHRFEIDHEGKDSWRFTKAGAAISMISSAEKTAYIEQGSLRLDQLIAMVHGVDVILVEGWKNNDLPQIGIARNATGKGFTAPLEHFMAIVTDIEGIETEIPRFTLEDTKGLTEFIMSKLQSTKDFTHFGADGRAKMVDVGEKTTTCRTAVAAGRVNVSPETFALIKSGGMKKGDVLSVAQIAGVMGAKRTPDLIPMCHPILIDGIALRLSLHENAVEIEATVRCDGRTGVEMEALTAVSVAALTVYDMCKAVQKDITITDIRLIQKTGGIHGDFHRKED